MSLTESIVGDTALSWFGVPSSAVGHRPQMAPSEPFGSGIPNNGLCWGSQHWRALALHERIEPYNQTLPGAAFPVPDDVFGPPARISVSSSPNLGGSSPNLGESRNADGCLVSDQLALRVIDDLGVLSARLRGTLESVANEPRSKGKVDREVLIEVILRLCEGRFVMLRTLAEIVQRKPETLRDQYLSRLVRERKLTLAFPKTPTHERQAYTTTGATTA